MSFDDMIAVKQRLIEVSAIVALVFGVALMCAAFCAAGCWRRARKTYDANDTELWCGLGALFLGMAGVLSLISGTHNYLTANLEARADVANYRLVEIKR